MSEEHGLWWLSFVDTDKSAPEGEQVPGGGGFQGVAIVEAESFVAAVQRSWVLGCNPGGQVGGWGPLPLDACGPELRDRLLTKDEIVEAGL